MSFIVYILLSTKIPKTYIGYTSNLAKRIKYHNTGKVKATKHYRPWKVIYKRVFLITTESKKA